MATTSIAKIEKDDTKTFLTLGDGDFTYSLDLARFLEKDANKKDQSYHLIATGIDTPEELGSKYKDTPFVLRELKCTMIKVSIHHGVNAMMTESNNVQIIPPADHVMFHHPHLGTEDAALHSRFLCHLMHSATNLWMKPGVGVFHLTLVRGQYERWKCEQAATRQDMVLLQRLPFKPPTVDKPTYTLRRHQSGKSFETRRGSGSETFTFGRKCDNGMHVACFLPWQTWQTNDAVQSLVVAEEPRAMLACSFCDRVFREERSRKLHIRDKHPDGANKKLKTIKSDAESFQCQLCRTEEGGPRVFVSSAALQDHVKAKHSAIHKEILPDWHRRDGIQKVCSITNDDALLPNNSNNSKQSTGTIQVQDFGTCQICGIKFRHSMHKQQHLSEFIPTESKESFQCSFCSKKFREKRAKLQHENYCIKQFTIN